MKTLYIYIYIYIVIGIILFDLKIPMWKLINELMPWSFYYLLFIFLEIDVLVLIPNIPWMGPWRDGFERILVRLWHSGFERIFFGMNWCLGSTKLSIPYRIGRYGRNILYRPAIRYVRLPCFVPKKYRPYRPYQPYRSISGNTGRYRKKFFFFFFFFKFCNSWIFVRIEW